MTALWDSIPEPVRKFLQRHYAGQKIHYPGHGSEWVPKAECPGLRDMIRREHETNVTVYGFTEAGSVRQIAFTRKLAAKRIWEMLR